MDDPTAPPLRELLMRSARFVLLAVLTLVGCGSGDTPGTYRGLYFEYEDNTQATLVIEEHLSVPHERKGRGRIDGVQGIYRRRSPTTGLFGYRVDLDGRLHDAEAEALLSEIESIEGISAFLLLPGVPWTDCAQTSPCDQVG